MSAQGGAQPFNLTGQGDTAVIMTGAFLDCILERLNALSAMQIKPDSNVGIFSLNRGTATLDLASLDSRLASVEANLGLSGTSTNTTTIVQNITNLQGSIANLEGRLNNASATANCVGNAVVVTVTF